MCNCCCGSDAAESDGTCVTSSKKFLGLYPNTCGYSTPPPPPRPAFPPWPDFPCFPSSATVQRADGATVPLSALSADDSILAAAADGTLGFDVVSSFSLADPSAKAAFLSLTTASATVTLTPTHKLPAGPAKELKQASEVAVGETIWLASPAAGALVQALESLPRTPHHTSLRAKPLPLLGPRRPSSR